MSRKTVAYIAQITNLENIPEKDKIKLATIEAKDTKWNVIVDSKFTLNQKVIYCEYDTIIKAIKPWNEFLIKRCYSPKYNGLKISAMKMAGVVSYGIVFSIEEVYKYDLEIQNKILNYPLGYDMSNAIEAIAIDNIVITDNSCSKELTPFQKFVKKYCYFLWKIFYYRKPNNCDFPSDCVPKTDSTRIENLQYLFDEKYKGTLVYITQKMDGQSATFAIKGNKFIIASRNSKKYEEKLSKAMRELTYKNSHNFSQDMIILACKYRIPYFMKQYRDYFNSCWGDFWDTKGNKIGKLTNFAIQGEHCSPKTQGGKTGVKESTLFLFNLYDSVKRKYMTPKYLKIFCNMSKIPMVPVISDYYIFDWKSTADLKAMAKGTYELTGKPQEGIVIRKLNRDNEVYLCEPERGMSNLWDFKVINDDYV